MNSRKGGRFAEFLTGKGFYVILFLCIAAIGVSGYMLISPAANRDKPEDTPEDFGDIDFLDYPDDAGEAGDTSGTDGTDDTGGISYPEALDALDRATVPQPPVMPSPEHDDGDIPVAAITSVPGPTATAASAPASASTPASAPAPTPKPKSAVFVWPVKGEAINVFSDSELVYNKTMGDWRVHLGMDITAELGEQVFAVSDGRVKDVYEDVFWGTTVVIDHGDGVVSKYSNLMKKPTVYEGDMVKAGQVIGGVGSTAEAERREVSHLHFAMDKDNKPTDPLLYLPAQ